MSAGRIPARVCVGQQHPPSVAVGGNGVKARGTLRCPRSTVPPAPSLAPEGNIAGPQGQYPVAFTPWTLKAKAPKPRNA